MPCFTLPSCLAKIILNSLLSFRGRKYSTRIPAWLSCKFRCLPNELACSQFFTKWSYWLLPKLAGILQIECKYPSHIHYSFTCYPQLPTSPRRISLPPSSHQYSGNIQRLFINNPKIFKDFFACKIVLAANHQLYPGNIQRPFGQQSAAAISSSNQQQQPAAATSSSNQQQQSAAAINSSNQLQQSTAATSSINQQQQLAATTSFRPTSSTYTIHDDTR